MPIELIPKPEIEKKPFDLTKFLLYLAIIILIGSVGLYFLFDFVLIKNSSKILAELETQLSLQMTDEAKSNEAKLIKWRQKIEDFRILLDSHQNPSKVFPLLEKLTHPKVWFTDFSLNFRTQKTEEGDEVVQPHFQLQGVAESFRVLGEQLLIFKKDENIKEIKLSNVYLGEKGNVRFQFEITFNPEIFKP